MDAGLAEKFSLTTAAEYLSKRLGVRVSERTMYRWLKKGYVQRFRNPGPRGHYFFTREMLDEIAEEMLKGGHA